MPEYIPNVLTRFKHPIPKKRQNNPHSWTPPNFGAKTQFASNQDISDTLPNKDKLFVQQVVGSLLYYALAVDCTFLVALGDCIQPSSAYKRYYEKINLATKLCSFKSQCCNHVRSKRYVPPCS